MFEKLKAKRIVQKTLNDVRWLIDELPKHDVFLLGGIDDFLISSFFVAFLDFYACAHKRSEFGKLVVNSFLEKVEFVELYRGLISDAEKEYQQIIKECLQSDNSPNGLYKGYVEISRHISEKLLIDSSKADVFVIIDSILLQRMNDLKKAIHTN